MLAACAVGAQHWKWMRTWAWVMFGVNVAWITWFAIGPALLPPEPPFSRSTAIA
jgi:hypothetical protein